MGGGGLQPKKTERYRKVKIWDWFCRFILGCKPPKIVGLMGVIGHWQTGFFKNPGYPSSDYINNCYLILKRGLQICLFKKRKCRNNDD